MVYTERRVRVSCSVYDMLHTDAKCYIIMCKLVKLAFCLCCEQIDPSNMGFHKSTLVARGANTQLDPSCVYQRWSEYNTNVLEYEYDYFEHA